MPASVKDAHAGIGFRETMAGGFALGATDPAVGAKGPHELEEEHDRIVVGLLHLQPDDGALVGRRPQRERGRLAGPRGGAEKDQRLGAFFSAEMRSALQSFITALDVIDLDPTARIDTGQIVAAGTMVMEALPNVTEPPARVATVLPPLRARSR